MSHSEENSPKVEAQPALRVSEGVKSDTIEGIWDSDYDVPTERPSMNEASAPKNVHRPESPTLRRRVEGFGRVKGEPVLMSGPLLLPRGFEVVSSEVLSAFKKADVTPGDSTIYSTGEEPPLQAYFSRGVFYTLGRELSSDFKESVCYIPENDVLVPALTVRLPIEANAAEYQAQLDQLLERYLPSEQDELFINPDIEFVLRRVLAFATWTGRTTQHGYRLLGVAPGEFSMTGLKELCAALEYLNSIEDRDELIVWKKPCIKDKRYRYRDISVNEVLDHLASAFRDIFAPKVAELLHGLELPEKDQSPSQHEFIGSIWERLSRENKIAVLRKTALSSASIQGVSRLSPICPSDKNNNKITRFYYDSYLDPTDKKFNLVARFLTLVSNMPGYVKWETTKETRVCKVFKTCPQGERRRAILAGKLKIEDEWYRGGDLSATGIPYTNAQQFERTYKFPIFVGNESVQNEFYLDITSINEGIFKAIQLGWQPDTCNPLYWDIKFDLSMPDLIKLTTLVEDKTIKAEARFDLWSMEHRLLTKGDDYASKLGLDEAESLGSFLSKSKIKIEPNDIVDGDELKEIVTRKLKKANEKTTPKASSSDGNVQFNSSSSLLYEDGKIQFGCKPFEFMTSSVGNSIANDLRRRVKGFEDKRDISLFCQAFANPNPSVDRVDFGYLYENLHELKDTKRPTVAVADEILFNTTYEVGDLHFPGFLKASEELRSNLRNSLKREKSDVIKRVEKAIAILEKDSKWRTPQQMSKLRASLVTKSKFEEVYKLAFRPVPDAKPAEQRTRSRRSSSQRPSGSRNRERSGVPMYQNAYQPPPMVYPPMGYPAQGVPSHMYPGPYAYPNYGSYIPGAPYGAPRM